MAKQAFQKALKLAKGQDNTEAEQALQQALADIKKKLVNQQDNSDSEVDETGKAMKPFLYIYRLT